MKRILVATDFSTRSDRALRRATLLARQSSAEIIVVHVVDDDQPLRLVNAEEREAQDLLTELAATLRKIDLVRCDTRVVLGEPFRAIADAAEHADADVVVMGPHRRQILRDVFIGTTIERTIRISRRPVIMANAVPVGIYDRVLVATDFSGCAAIAVKKARELGLLDFVKVDVIHAFDLPARGLITRSTLTMDQLKEYTAEEEERAAGELSKFLHDVDLQPGRRFIKPIELSAPEAIRDCIRKHKIDLVVIGTHGRTGPAKFFLGSVAEEVLRESDVDVLVVHASSAGGVTS